GGASGVGPRAGGAARGGAGRVARRGGGGGPPAPPPAALWLLVPRQEGRAVGGVRSTNQFPPPGCDSEARGGTEGVQRTCPWPAEAAGASASRAPLSPAPVVLFFERRHLMFDLSPVWEWLRGSGQRRA